MPINCIADGGSTVNKNELVAAVAEETELASKGDAEKRSMRCSTPSTAALQEGRRGAPGRLRHLLASASAQTRRAAIPAPAELPSPPRSSRSSGRQGPQGRGERVAAWPRQAGADACRSMRRGYSRSHRARGRVSSAVEHLVYTERVGGSNPLIAHQPSASRYCVHTGLPGSHRRDRVPARFCRRRSSARDAEAPEMPWSQA